MTGPLSAPVRFTWLPAFVRSYMATARDTEPATIHHLACALALLSVGAGGATTVAYGSKQVKLNLYVSLVGPSGCRKTEAMLYAMPIFRAVADRHPDCLKPPLADITSNVSAMEAADRRRNRVVCVRRDDGTADEYAQLFIVASEFGAFIRRRDLDMVSFLTTIYDGAISKGTFDYETQTGGKFTLVNPYAVMLMGSTLRWLGERLPRGSREGGFLNRFLFFYSDRFEPRSFPQYQYDTNEAREETIRIYSKIATSFPRIDWTAEARDKFASWYEPTRGGLVTEEDQTLHEWTSRLGIFIVKLAGLSAIADGRDMIEPRDLSFAWCIMHFARAGIQMAHSATGDNADGWLETQIIRRIMNSDTPIPVSVLCRDFATDIPAFKMRQLLTTLAHSNVLYLDKSTDRVSANTDAALEYIRQPEQRDYDLTMTDLEEAMTCGT